MFFLSQNSKSVQFSEQNNPDLVSSLIINLKPNCVKETENKMKRIENSQNFSSKEGTLSFRGHIVGQGGHGFTNGYIVGQGGHEIAKFQKDKPVVILVGAGVAHG